MDRYTKTFIVASLACLVAASALGLWIGAGDAPGWAWFGHVHFNLLGFMAMMHNADETELLRELNEAAGAR